MKIAALRLHNVKRFAGRGVAIENIGEGVNVLCAVNEHGKSTSFEALHALFFQPHTSTAGDVRNLRPYSGGNPLVEADIETESGRYRITKQFYGGRSARVVDLSNGRLVAQADEAETFIAGLVRGGTAGPAGLLWVRQGITGIEKRSKSEEDGENRVRASLLESVQGEVEAVTGGRRMAEIMAATQEALDALVTEKGKPKAGFRYAAAIAERDRLEAEEQRLAREVAALRDALDKRVTAGRRLAELERPQDRQERQQAIAAAEAAFAAAKAQGDALRAAEAELRLTAERCDAASRDLTSFRAAMERTIALDARRAGARQARADALARREAATAALAQARAESDAAETEEGQARALLARLASAMSARESAERLGALERVLEAAETARKEIEAGEAELALLRISERALEELEAAEIELSKMEAVAQAGRPSVAIAYAAGAPTVTLDGVPLTDGEPRSHGGQARLEIPGVGVVTLRSGRLADGGEKLRQMHERRSALLATLAVSDLAAARSRQAEAARRESALRETKARLAVLAPEGLGKLREEVARRREAAGLVLELKGDPDAIKAAHEAAELRRAVAKQALREAEPLPGLAADALGAAQAVLAGLDAEAAQLDAVLGPVETRAERERLLAEQLAALEARLAGQQAEVDALRAGAVEPAVAEAALRRLRSVADSVEREIATLRETMAALGAQIRARADEAVEEIWRETAEALEAARSRVAAFEREVVVLQRLATALETARSQARELYLRPVMNELRPLLGLLFDDVSITFDEKTLLPDKILRGGQEEEVERLSGGMREQLSVLTRLAFARLLARDGRPAPVILDDALVYSDDDRIEKMFDALHLQARDQQIIVFSCRQRAFQRLGGHALSLTDWTPER